MKTIFINLLVIFLLFVAYYIDFFGWFTGKKMFYFALGLVIVLFFIGCKVFGAPFSGDKDENDDK